MKRLFAVVCLLAAIVVLPSFSQAAVTGNLLQSILKAINGTEQASVTGAVDGLVISSEGDIDPQGGTGTICITLTSSNLRYGAKDSQTNGEVSDLQAFLQAAGYLSSEPTGYFGLQTQAAVKKFQSANNFTPTGYVGPLTRAKIEAISCNGAIVSNITPTPAQAAGNPETGGSGSLITKSSRLENGSTLITVYVKAAPVNSRIVRNSFSFNVCPGAEVNVRATGNNILSTFPNSNCVMYYDSNINDRRFDSQTNTAILQVAIKNSREKTAEVSFSFSGLDVSGYAIAKGEAKVLVPPFNTRPTATPTPSAPTIQLISPNGGEYYVPGEIINVSFKNSGVVGPVYFYLRNSAGTLMNSVGYGDNTTHTYQPGINTIAFNPAKGSNYGSDQLVGNFKLDVCDQGTFSPIQNPTCDTSDNYFIISSTATPTPTPTGGPSVTPTPAVSVTIQSTTQTQNSDGVSRTANVVFGWNANYGITVAPVVTIYDLAGTLLATRNIGSVSGAGDAVISFNSMSTAVGTGGLYRVKVCIATVCGQSNYFTITPLSNATPTLIMSPLVNENWSLINPSVTIKWTTTGIPATAAVSIIATPLNYPGSYYVLSGNAVNNGSATVNISSLSAGTYAIKATASLLDGNAAHNYSDTSNVTISNGPVVPPPPPPVNPALTITSPNGGEIWSTATPTRTITWNTTGIPTTAAVSINAIPVNAAGATIGSYYLVNGNASNTGSATINLTILPGGLYKIEVAASLLDGNAAHNYKDQSDGTVYITTPVAPQPALTVTSPNGGGEWTGVDPKTITWTTTGIAASASVSIALVRGTTTYILAGSFTNSGTATISPSGIPKATDYKIKVTASLLDGNSAHTYSDLSDGTFSIK